jgi:predicted RNase H-like HicB family nuclease
MELTAVIVFDHATRLLVATVPGLPGAHAIGGSIEEVQSNLDEVLTLLKDQDALHFEAGFVGLLRVPVA